MVPVSTKKRIDEERINIEDVINSIISPEMEREVEMIRDDKLNPDALSTWLLKELDKREEERWPIRSRHEALQAINMRWGINGTVAESAVKICEECGIYF